VEPARPQSLGQADPIENIDKQELPATVKKRNSGPLDSSGWRTPQGARNRRPKLGTRIKVGSQSNAEIKLARDFREMLNKHEIGEILKTLHRLANAPQELSAFGNDLKYIMIVDPLERARIEWLDNLLFALFEDKFQDANPGPIVEIWNAWDGLKETNSSLQVGSQSSVLDADLAKAAKALAQISKA
jgi:hypothetical protein